MKNHNLTEDKLFKLRIRHLKAVATLLQLTPFLRCIMLNGSLAEGKIRLSSDIDLLLVAKDRRIFTARFFASILTWFTSLKRSSNTKKDHSGKFCLNYFLTENFLVVPTGRGEKIDRYCAHNYSNSLMIWGKRDVYFNFINANRENWKKFLIRNKIPALPAGRQDTNIKQIQNRNKIKSSIPIRTFHMGVRFRDIVEKMIGDRIEQYLKKIQLRKIKIDDKYVVANDKELRFHSPN